MCQSKEFTLNLVIFDLLTYVHKMCYRKFHVTNIRGTTKSSSRRVEMMYPPSTKICITWHFSLKLVWTKRVIQYCFSIKIQTGFPVPSFREWPKTRHFWSGKSLCVKETVISSIAWKSCWLCPFQLFYFPHPTSPYHSFLPLKQCLLAKKGKYFELLSKIVQSCGWKCSLWILLWMHK